MTKVPHAVSQYQSAHDRGDVDAALATFTPTATVKDDGHEYQGPDEIRDWLARASAEFTYTRTLIGAEFIDANTWLVTNHLEGDFPGGGVDLRYRFVLVDGLISELQNRALTQIASASDRLGALADSPLRCRGWRGRGRSRW
jgi:hypothetical protein